MQDTQHFQFLLVENFTHIAFSCAVEPLRIANHVAGQDLYRWSFASEDGAFALASNGVETRVHHSFRDAGNADFVFALSGLGVQSVQTEGLLAAVRRARAHGAQIGALCSAAFILARGGVLDHQQAAIHWDYHDSFEEAFPNVTLSRSVFVTDAKVITASGGTATADLMIHLIAKRHGTDLATQVADQMVYNAVRDANATQRVSLQSRHGIRNAHLADAIRLMHDNIDDPQRPSDIAQRIGISGRQMERLFERYLACSPKKYYVDLRLQKAKRLLVQTELSVTDIAMATGFNSPTHFSKSFRAHFGISPKDQKNQLG